MTRLFLCFLLGFQPGCLIPPKPTTSHINQLCILRPADNMCWIDKTAKTGIPLNKTDGFFAMSPEDTDDILFRLNQCEGTKK